MRTAAAAAYCGFATAWGLRKAHQRGKVFPAGRRGGTGTHMWRREDLDRFLCGVTMTEWVTRWGYEISKTPVRRGIWRLKTGGHLIRGRVTDPRTGKRHQEVRVLHNATVREAQRALDETMSETRERVKGKTRTRTRWSEFAASLFEDKVLRNKLKSAATREWWSGTLRHYLVPAFGHFWVDELRRGDIKAWTTKVALWIRDGKPSIRRAGMREKLSPRTANGWLRILRTICHAAKVRCELPKSAFEGIEFFEEPRAYTKELPNAVPPAFVSKFLEKAREIAPNHYAMMMLGFVTGLRPSSLRTLRRHGLERDVLWDEGVILVRRSNSRGKHIMDQTKTGTDLELCLPPVMMDVLREHVAALPAGPMRESEYLFPSITEGPRARTVLLKPFRDIGKALGLGPLTPRAMRRTFNDGARAAQLHDVVTRSISGHQTEQMHRHYSTAQADEQREELAKVYSLMVDGPRGVKKGVKDAVG